MNVWIEYLKSPELVVKVQEYFGIEYIKKEANHKNSTDLNHRILLLNGSSDEVKKTNSLDNNHHNLEHRHSPSGSDDESSSSTESQQQRKDCLSLNGKTKEEKESQAGYAIRNKFWYYLFIIGTELGDELFYASFIPFWFWNIDSAVGRRVVFLWSVVMYIGQSMKDVVRWPRPGSPAIKLQKKWGLEYGMPSTHSMVAISIPFSVLIFTQQRYQYSALVGTTAAIIWCSVICLSRLYLGMHSVLDVVVGILLTISMMTILVPLVDYLDFFILSSPFSPFCVLFISIMLIVYYPRSDKWTPTRGDTTMSVSFCAGLQIGAWINYQLGDIQPTSLPPPYVIIWPTYQMLGLLILRTVLGLCCILATRAIGKSISYAFVCALLGKDKNELRNSESSLENKNKTTVDLCYKYFTYGMIGFNTQYLLPNAFKLVGLGRPDFYTEI